MSKSLGNMITMREFLKTYPGELFKFLILSSHYRSPLQFSQKSLEQALISLFKLYSGLAEAEEILESKSSLTEESSEESKQFEQKLQESEQEIQAAFNDDFATPKAFAVFFSLFHAFQKRIKNKQSSAASQMQSAEQYLVFFKKYGKILALFQEKPRSFLRTLENKFLEQQQITREQVNQIVQKRSLARQKKDFKKADELRKELDKWKIEIKDSSEGSQWRFNPSQLAHYIKK